MPGLDEPAWTYCAVSYDSAAGIAKGYMHGLEQYSITNSSGGLEPNANDNPLMISRADQRGYYGRLDEVRVSLVVRSPDWLKASWQSQAAPEEFAHYGAVEWIPEPAGVVLWIGIAGFAFRKGT